jgi:hypothetical protein
MCPAVIEEREPPIKTAAALGLFVMDPVGGSH